MSWVRSGAWVGKLRWETILAITATAVIFDGRKEGFWRNELLSVCVSLALLKQTIYKEVFFEEMSQSTKGPSKSTRHLGFR